MKILLAIDGSTCSEAAERAVTTQFPPRDTEVRVVHAVEWMRDRAMSIAFAEGAGAARHVMAIRERAMQEANALVAATTARLGAAGFRTTTTVRDGAPRDVILDCAAEWHPDLIVIGSHGRTGIDRFVLGSVSESIVRRAGCSVEIVRAAGNGAPA